MGYLLSRAGRQVFCGSGGKAGDGEIPMKKFAKIFKNESGATAIEYGLLAALIAVVIIGGATFVGRNTGSALNSVATSVASTS